MLLRLIELDFNHRFCEECIQNAFSAFSKECIQNAFSAKTKNQDSPRTPEQILEFPNQNQEPRFPQDSWKKQDEAHEPECSHLC